VRGFASPWTGNVTDSQSFWISCVRMMPCTQCATVSVLWSPMIALAVLPLCTPSSSSFAFEPSLQRVSFGAASTSVVVAASLSFGPPCVFVVSHASLTL
jgi:hypothetical protein